MQMKHRIPPFIRKEGAGAGDLVHIFQNIFQGSYRQLVFAFRPHDEFAASISSADNDQRSGRYGMITGKLLDGRMNNLSVFQAKDKNPAGFAL